MLYRGLFPRQFFPDLDRLQRELQGAFDPSPGIRGVGRGGYPALNVGSTPASVEIYAFAPGMKPDGIEVQFERGVLTISGERAPDLQPGADGGANAGQGNASGTGNGNGRPTMHLDERFAGRFRRVVSLPDDVDPDACSADYRDGVLHISIKRRESMMPRRISVQ